MTIELYIGGQPVDLPRSQKLTFDFNSNFLDDISKLQSCYSYSVTLPRTQRNARALDYPENIAHESTTPRRFMDAVLLINGIDLFGCTGRGVLLSVGSGGYDMCFTWNRTAALAAWLDSDKSIRDIPRLGVTWSRTPGAYNPGTMLPMNVDYNTGVYLNQHTDLAPYPALGASALLSYVMNSIAGEAVMFGLPDEVDTELEQMAVPFVTRDSITDSESLKFSASRVYYTKIQGKYPLKLYFVNGYYTDRNSNYNGYSYNFTRKPKTTEILVRFKWDGSGATDISTGTFRVMGIKSDNSEEEVYSQVIRKKATWDIDIEQKIDISGYTGYYFQVTANIFGGNIDYNQQTSYYIIPSLFEVVPQFDKVYLGDTFSTNNLPDIKQVDYVKAVCALFNMAAVPDRTMSLGFSFVTRESIITDAAKAQDWSSRLVGSGEPDEVEFTLDALAQNNWFRWKENKNIEVDGADGELVTEDTTIDADADYYTLPFVATNYDNIPIFKEEYKNGVWTVKEQKVEPHFMELRPYNNGAALRFTDALKWPARLTKWYPRTAEVLRKPLQVKCTMRLTAMDVAGFDYSKPVYIGQWGQCFIVERIRFSTSGLSTVTMIKI